MKELTSWLLGLLQKQKKHFPKAKREHAYHSKPRYYLYGNGYDTWSIDFLRPHHDPQLVKEFKATDMAGIAKSMKDINFDRFSEASVKNNMFRELCYVIAKSQAENYIKTLKV